MVQFYFLSVLANLIVGFMLVFRNQNETVEESDSVASETSFLDEKKIRFLDIFNQNSFLQNNIFILAVIGISIFTAFIKLLSPLNGVFIFGDLIPAVAGFAGGGAVLANYYIENSSTDLKLPEILQFLIVDSQKIVGYACIVVAVIHFIIPGVLFF